MKRDDLRFLVVVKKADYNTDLFTIEAYPVHMEDGKVRNFSGSSYDPEPLADLRISAQGQLPDGSEYGLRAEYRDVFAANLPRAEVMVKTLRKIERGVAKLDAQFGTSYDFAHFLAKIAHILGATGECLGFNRSKAPGSWSHDDQDYVWTDATGIAYWISTQINQLRETATV